MLLVISTIIITSFVLFFIGICRVDAASYIGVYDRTNGGELKTQSGNSINVWTGQTGNFTGLTDNWNKIGLYFHTNLDVVNGHTYYFQFTVTLKTQPVTVQALACEDWNISAFSLRYPTQLNAFPSNQVTLIDSTLDKGTCIVEGSSENIQSNTYVFYGHFSANKTTNVLGARLQVYTSYTQYMQSVFSNVSLVITEEATQNGEIVSAINNSTSAQNQNRDNNTNKILDKMDSLLGGQASTFNNPDQSSINSLNSYEAIANGTGATESAFMNNVGIGTGYSSSDNANTTSFITRCWNLFLSNTYILSLLIAILSIGVISHLTGRSG